MFNETCYFPLAPGNTSSGCISQSELHPIYYNVSRVSTLLVALVFIGWEGFVLWKKRESESPELMMRFLSVLCGLMLMVMGADPSSLGNIFDYRLNLAMLWLIASISSNFQIACLSGYLRILDHVQPEETCTLLSLSKKINTLHLLGDLSLILGPIFIEEQTSHVVFSTVLAVGILVTMSLNGGHFLYCFSLSKNLAPKQTETAVDDTVIISSRAKATSSQGIKSSKNGASGKVSVSSRSPRQISISVGAHRKESRDSEASRKVSLDPEQLLTEQKQWEKMKKISAMLRIISSIGLIMKPIIINIKNCLRKGTNRKTIR